jgi:hypothetical protein
MPLALTPLAEQDLEAIGDYIAADNPTRPAALMKTRCSTFFWIDSRSVGQTAPIGLLKVTQSRRKHTLMRPVCIVSSLVFYFTEKIDNAAMLLGQGLLLV